MISSVNDESIARKAAFIGALLGRELPERVDSGMVQWIIPATLGAMTYAKMRELLSADDADLCRRQYMYGAVGDMRSSVAYEDVRRALNESGIDFLPMKGMALVLQKVYPNGALRLHCDIDLLCRSEEDCLRAVAALERCGWKTLSGEKSYHHVPPMFRKKVMLELHHMLPGVRSLEMNRECWRERFVRQGDSHEYRLTDELHFAVLFAHTAINHDWEYGERFLLDAGMLLARPGFDVEKAFAYCREMGITRPENLLAAFPDIFGGEGDVQQFAVARRHMLGDTIPFASLVMSAPERFSWSWWRKRLGGFGFKWLRQKYGAENAGWRRMLKIVWMDYKQKIANGFLYLFASDAAEVRKENSAKTMEQLGITVPNEEMKYL